MADSNVPVPTGGAVAMNAASQLPAPDWRTMLSGFTGQPALRRALPALVGVGAVGIVAALYMTIAQGPQRVLYTSLTDSERAQVAATLDTGGITYSIDNSTGALSVAEDDVYRARMLVASDAGLAAPAGASEMLDAIPLGSSRTLEGERLRLARERELTLTIREIDGIESVRVHLATPERSVFVRQNSDPTASVMVRLAGGRSLSQSQVEAIVNLVSGSVPGMTSDSVRVVDQNGRLLSSEHDSTMDALLLQSEFEGKLREQLTTLLMPLLGDGNFSSQVQVTLDQSEITSARESYDQEGAVRSESERNSSRSSGGGGAVGGIPGVTANTPPADAQLVDAAPDPAAVPATAATGAGTGDSESAVQRNYELGREVAVTNTRPGGLVKLSVAVAVSDEALKAAAPLTAEKLQSLIGAAVGADTARGDKVQVVVSTFESADMPELAFYEQPWFATILRYSAALIAVLLVLLLAVRPLIARLRSGGGAPSGTAGEISSGESSAPIGQSAGQSALAAAAVGFANPDQVDLPQRVELARQLAKAQPDRAVEALQRMLDNSADLSQRAS